MVIKDIEYLLTDREAEFLRMVGKLRGTSFPDKEHSANAKLMCGSGTDEEKSLRGSYYGVVGEYVFAKTHGGFFDPVPQKYGDNNEPDVHIGSTGFAVKTIGHKYRKYLIQNMNMIVKSQYIALCHFDGERKVIVIGYATSDEFMKGHHIDDFGYGPTMCLEFK